MQNRDERDAADAEIERVRRHVMAVRERIRALDSRDSESGTSDNPL